MFFNYTILYFILSDSNDFRVMIAIQLLFALCLGVQSFYLPGVAPYNYEENEVVDLKVNKLSSVHTQVPYDYYSLKYCKPKEIKPYSENLGEFLSGDRIENSPYEVRCKQYFAMYLTFCADSHAQRRVLQDFMQSKS